MLENNILDLPPMDKNNITPAKIWLFADFDERLVLVTFFGFGVSYLLFKSTKNNYIAGTASTAMFYLVINLIFLPIAPFILVYLYVFGTSINKF